MEDDASSTKPDRPFGQSVPTKNIIEDHQILSAEEISLVSGEVNSMYYNRLTFAIPKMEANWWWQQSAKRMWKEMLTKDSEEKESSINQVTK